MTTNLSPEELRRYNRHIILPEVGIEGQVRLKESSVLLVGAGGLGSPMAMYLAAAGVGRIGIVDFDVVEESNLQRQILHGQSSIGMSKLESAKIRLLDINPHIQVEGHNSALLSENAMDILGDYDVIADGTDNFPTRYLVNDACVLLGKPNVYGSIFRFEGQVSVFNYNNGPCYRCLYGEPPPPGLVPSCAEGGVFGILPGVVGCMQASEIIKIIVQIGEVFSGHLLIFDALTMKFRRLKLRKDEECVLCGKNPSVTQLIDYEAFCGIKPAKEAEAEANANHHEISPKDLSLLITKSGTQENNGANVNILDVREPYETEISKIEGSLLIPLGELANRYAELESKKEWIVHCKSGMRSGRAVEFLRSKGYKRVKNLTGGINAYAKEVDKNIPVY